MLNIHIKVGPIISNANAWHNVSYNKPCQCRSGSYRCKATEVIICNHHRSVPSLGGFLEDSSRTDSPLVCLDSAISAQSEDEKGQDGEEKCQDNNSPLARRRWQPVHIAVRRHPRQESGFHRQGPPDVSRIGLCGEEDGLGGAELQDSCTNQPSTRRRNRHQYPKTITQKMEMAPVFYICNSWLTCAVAPTVGHQLAAPTRHQPD